MSDKDRGPTYLDAATRSVKNPHTLPHLSKNQKKSTNPTEQILEILACSIRQRYIEQHPSAPSSRDHVSILARLCRSPRPSRDPPKALPHPLNIARNHKSENHRRCSHRAPEGQSRPVQLLRRSAS
jgi:hypothetical protein